MMNWQLFISSDGSECSKLSSGHYSGGGSAPRTIFRSKSSRWQPRHQFDLKDENASPYALDNQFFKLLGLDVVMKESTNRTVEAQLSRRTDSFVSSEESLLQRFNRYFQVVAANTPDLVRQAQEIRYQVYCVEHQFENPAEHLDGRENDEFDALAVHSLLIHRASSQPVGTVRLVLARPHAPEESFAIQRLVGPSAIAGVGHFPIRSMGEVSRFSISKEFRRRKADTTHGVEEVDSNAAVHIDRRTGPLMSLGLIQSLVRMSAEHRITHWCAVMEPKLLRMLAAMAIRFEPIGAPVEYHGLRQPCYCHIGTVLDCVKRERPTFWEVLTDAGTLWPLRSPPTISPSNV